MVIPLEASETSRLAPLDVGLPDLNTLVLHAQPLLQAIAAVSTATLATIAAQLREATLPYVGSSALIIFTEDCTGRPQKKAGKAPAAGGAAAPPAGRPGTPRPPVTKGGAQITPAQRTTEYDVLARY